MFFILKFSYNGLVQNKKRRITYLEKNVEHVFCIRKQSLSEYFSVKLINRLNNKNHKTNFYVQAIIVPSNLLICTCFEVKTKLFYFTKK